ncbi:metalloprotease [Capsulimonas corticalis]|uniref:Metalloprotease n=1 Tax=Capsulimonas corticalis TaxID=2219043 RepID=A0A402D340_9BACT|nr:M48 family metallopeptidase [Capsulimonas corticalis]BDI28517.1 metalloprotease [Capsulimonas corticalis]
MRTLLALLLLLCCLPIGAAPPRMGMRSAPPELVSPSGALARASLGASSEEVRPPVVTPAARRYSQTRYLLYFAGTAYGLLALWALLTTGLSARLRDLAERLSQRRFLTLLWYYVLFTLAFWVIRLPLILYSGYWLDHAYGLSHQSFGAWMGDVAKSHLVDVATTVPVLWLVFWLMGRSPRRWPLGLWLACIPLIAVGMFASPLIVDPIFNKFTPMAPGPLKTRIEALAATAGIPDAPILVADKSRQTDETNAYVNGVGTSARIVLWDTTLKKMPPDQVVAIVGHEMGHYVLKHLYWGFLETFAGLLIALPLARGCYDRLIARWGDRWRLRDARDYAAIPAIFLVVSALSFFSEPIVNWQSRRVEHAADAYGLQVTGDRAAMARGFVSLSEQNLSDPNPPPFIKFWLFSHPPLQERIDFALGKK